jgi:hypothetical protein
MGSYPTYTASTPTAASTSRRVRPTARGCLTTIVKMLGFRAQPRVDSRLLLRDDRWPVWRSGNRTGSGETKKFQHSIKNRHQQLAGGGPIWRWAAEQSFLLASQEIQLLQRCQRDYCGRWTDDGRRGAPPPAETSYTGPRRVT